MGNELYINLEHALVLKKSVTVPIKEIELTSGEDWLLEFSAKVYALGASASPHQTDDKLVLVTRD